MHFLCLCTNHIIPSPSDHPRALEAEIQRLGLRAFLRPLAAVPGQPVAIVAAIGWRRSAANLEGPVLTRLPSCWLAAGAIQRGHRETS